MSDRMSLSPPTPPQLDFLPPDEHLLTTKEVAQWLRISVRSVENLVHDGELHPIKARRLNRFTIAEVKAFIARWNQKGLPRHVNGTPILPKSLVEDDDFFEEL
jgi:excisionase family DNA binding protein